MPNLKLIPANQNRISGDWDDDDYDVVLVDSGETVGRIFKSMVSFGNPNAWFWGLAQPHSHIDTRNYGYCESKEAAKLAFAERWREL